MSDPIPTDSEDMAAAETALGVLEGEERAAADRRRLADPAFAEAVEGWSLRFGRIAVDEAADRAPPPGLWPRIEQKLGDAASVVEMRLRRSLTLWRSTAIGAGIAAAVLAVVIVAHPPTPAAAPPSAPTIAAAPAPGLLQTASLSDAKGRAVVFIAVLDPDRGELILSPASVKPAPGKSPELWVIPTGRKPISLGVIQFGKPVRVKVRDLVGQDASKTLAVTMEAAGGSPTGQPQGPVMASGQLQSL